MHSHTQDHSQMLALHSPHMHSPHKLTSSSPFWGCTNQLYFNRLLDLCRGALYVEAPEGRDWGWYSPQQIPSLIAWLETGSQEEQQLAEDIYAMYQPVLKVVMQSKQVCLQACLQLPP